MDNRKHSISPDALYARLGSESAPIIVDVRAMLILPAQIRLWPTRFIALRTMWNSGELICRAGAKSSPTAFTDAKLAKAWPLHCASWEWKRTSWKAVLLEHPKIDRIACPWLIRRFIDPNAEFIYVPKDQVLAVAQQTGGIPYDIDGVEFTHEGERCSFDTILRIYDIKDPALDHLATIVRGADTSRHDLSPQCGGLFAISLGLSANFPNDHEMLKHGMVIYDALYTWCRSLQAETHNWPATKSA